jgi:hypothetical protein
MADDPLEAVYTYVERAYVRLQAGDVIMRCLEEGSPEPIHQMVEGLVLAGPRSLATLQEIQAEACDRKTQMLDDLHQIFTRLEKTIRKAGLDMVDLNGIMSILHVSRVELQRMMQERGIWQGNLEIEIIQSLDEAREMISGMASQIKMLEEIEGFLEDWVWGLTYERTHQPLEQVKGVRGERAC